MKSYMLQKANTVLNTRSTKGIIDLSFPVHGCVYLRGTIHADGQLSQRTLL